MGPHCAAVGVIPLAFGGDVVGHDAAQDGDAGGGESLAQGIEDGQGARVVLFVADGQQDRGVVGVGPQVAGGREVGGLLDGDCDVEPYRAAHDQSVAGVAVQHVGDDAVGGGEAEQAGGGADDVGWGA